MKKENMRRRALWTALSLAGMALAYWLCGCALFDLHGMKGWPSLLAGTGLVVLLVAAVTDCRYLGASTGAGYVLGFVCGLLFERKNVDPGGGTVSNGWLIWAGVFLAAMLFGLLFDLLRKRRKGDGG